MIVVPDPSNKPVSSEQFQLLQAQLGEILGRLNAMSSALSHVMSADPTQVSANMAENILQAASGLMPPVATSFEASSLFRELQAQGWGHILETKAVNLFNAGSEQAVLDSK